MKKHILSLTVILLVFAALLSACGNTEPTETTAAATLTEATTQKTVKTKDKIYQ
ncbi:MAG: hypothetical protein IKM29_03875 [Clostridia bacterium]|nr:hypothetical protein [Clostridia bacterium]